MRSPRILLITDPAYAHDLVLARIDAVARVMPPGTLAVQLRDKGRPPSELRPWAERLRAFTRDRGASLVVNGDVGLARDVGADGVHFGGRATREDFDRAEGLWRSMAAHDDEDVVRARRAGADAVLVSPIFETPGKAPARGVGALERAVALAAGELAVLALGGVDEGRAEACFAAGAHGVAMIRAILAAADAALIASTIATPAKEETTAGTPGTPSEEREKSS